MRSPRPVVALFVSVVLVAACGSTSPTPAPSTAAVATSGPSAATSSAPSPTEAATATPAPTPSPSPAAADVADAFNKAITSPLFSAHITVTGVTTVGSVNIPMQGTIDTAFGDTHTVSTSTVNGTASTTETITSGGRKYEKLFGAWFAAGKPGPDGLANVIKATGGFEDAGVVTKDGKSLHHMTLPAGTTVPAETLGLSGASISNATIGLEAWAADDGTPAAMTVTASWDQASGTTSVPATMTIEMAFEGKAASITAPTQDELWAWKTSTVHRYRVAYPSSWEYHKGSTKRADEFLGFDGSYVVVNHEARGTVTLNEFTSYVSKNLGFWSGLKSTKLDSSKPTRLAGVAARRIQYHGTYKGKRWTAIATIAVKGKYIYWLDLNVPGKILPADLAMLDTFLQSFSFK